MVDLFAVADAETLTAWPANYEDQFWNEYPRRIAKAAAMKALRRVRARGVSWQMVVSGVQRYKTWLAERSPGRWRPEPKHPATWLNGDCWNDELESSQAENVSMFDIATGNHGAQNR